MTEGRAGSRMRATARRDGTGFRHTVEAGEHHLTVDEPISAGGGDAGPDPQALLAASLASCSAITMEMYAQRKGWDIGYVEVAVEYTPAERGCLTKFELVLRLSDELSDGARRAPAGDRVPVPGPPGPRGRRDVPGAH